jgi:FKBP-type peptidyl-prolyl cis-trans isomerase 2
MKYLILVLCSLTALAANIVAAGKTAKDGDKISLAFTLTVEGKAVDSATAEKPLSFILGGDEPRLPAGLQKKLAGLAVGKEKTIALAADEGFTYDPEAVIRKSRQTLPTDMIPHEGVVLQLKSREGKMYAARMVKVDADSVTLDLNSPVAGKKLTYKVKIIAIE